MNEADFSIGPLMKAARKFRKFNQADVAQAIGCSQSALSKMEHNLLIPSAPQWFLFSRFTAIPPETLETGVIDRHSKVKFNNDEVSLGFKIPKRYRHYRAEKVREIYPFLQYLEKKMVPARHSDLIQQIGIDNEFFLDFDNLINFQLFIDTIEFFISLRITSPEQIRDIVTFGQNEVYWDHYSLDWKKLENPLALLTAFAKEQVFFQTDFQIKVESQAGKTLVSYYPEYHLKQFSSMLSKEVIQFLNNYRKATLEGLIERELRQKTRVDLIPEVAVSRLAARFELMPVV